MKLSDQFEIAGGSIVGREHTNTNKNNHDSYGFFALDNGIGAVVCDGCGSGKHSEVGAKIGCQIILNELEHQLAYGNLDFSRIKKKLLSNIYILSEAMGKSMSNVIRDYFLFTIVIAVINNDRTFITMLGDGAYIVNGEFDEVCYENNAPPYISYNITGSSREIDTGFLMQREIKTDHLDSLVIGSDGIVDLARVKEYNIPGKKKLVGNISQFWKDDAYFKNDFAISRKLRLLNKPSNKVDYDSRKTNKEPGLLPDDTTLVVIRRKHEDIR